MAGLQQRSCRSRNWPCWLTFPEASTTLSTTCKSGYVNAFGDVIIQSNIASLTGGIAVTTIEWSGANQQSPGQLGHMSPTPPAQIASRTQAATMRAFCQQ